MTPSLPAALPAPGAPARDEGATRDADAGRARADVLFPRVRLVDPAAGRWIETTKADQRPRHLADRHYTRQSPGHPMWTRPGWNQILYAEQANGRAAAWCWWRPKWESGIVGTERKDGLRCIECALFRNETRRRSSQLIREAVAIVLGWSHATDVDWPDGLITGVGSVATAGGRAAASPAGHCYREAGWEPFAHPGRNKRADVWLRCSADALREARAAAAALSA